MSQASNGAAILDNLRLQRPIHLRMAELHDALADEQSKLAVLLTDTKDAIREGESINRKSADQCREVVAAIDDALKFESGLN